MLIPSKLSRPVRLDHTVVRERLLAKLSGANNFRLALITSPAGYGKTTLISQWAAGKNDSGWYTLDEGDNQQERFASYLIAAVQQATNGHCAICETMAQKRQYASLTSLFAQLFIELAEWHSPLYLVIDDYHLITNPVIHESMRFFIRHQPENLTLVVLSRNLPQLGIANLRVRDQLLEIGSQQLAFTHQEAKQFFDCCLSSPIEAAESSRICDDVSGWATALQLIALSARQNTHSAHKSARRLAGINASHLSDYLVDEVLDNVDLATRHFLLKSAILRSMNDALITRVTGEENGQMRLEEIERQGLFLQRMDDTGEWFCYHPLFGNFLRQRCQWIFLGATLAGALLILLFSWLRYCKSPLRNTNTRKQFLYRKRFRNIIICTSVQCFNFICILTSGTDHNNRHVRPGTDFLYYFYSFHIRKPEIQKDNIRMMRRCFQNGRRAVFCCQIFIVMCL